MTLYEITSVVPQTGMLGWAASAHCLTEQFHSTLSSHGRCTAHFLVAPPRAEEGDDN